MQEPGKGTVKMTTQTRLGQILLYAAGALLAGGLALAALSCVSFEPVKAVIDAMAITGTAKIFTRDLYAQIMGRCRIFGAALSAAALLFFLGREQIRRYILELAASFAPFWKKTAAHFREAFLQQERALSIALLVIVLSAAAVRVLFLCQPMRYDESATFLYNASRPLVVAVSYYNSPNNHLFHTLLVHLAHSIFGSAPWAVRLPAFFFGVLLVPATFLVARLYFNRYAALLAAALAASSSALVEYSALARGYTILCFFTLLLFALGAYLRRNSDAFAWFIFALAAALGFYTVPVMLYPFGIIALLLFASIVMQNRGRCRVLLLRQMFISFLVAAAFTALFYLPVFVVSGPGAVTGNWVVAPQTWSYLSNNLPVLLISTWFQWNRDYPKALDLFLALGFLLSILSYRRFRKFPLYLLSATFIWLVPVIAAQRVVPAVRIWLFLLLFYLILAAAGFGLLLEKAAARWPRSKAMVFSVTAAALSLCLCLRVISAGTVYYSNETGTLRDGAAIAAYLQENLQPGDRVLANAPSDAILQYYFYRNGYPDRCLWFPVGEAKRIVVVVNESFSHTLHEMLAGAGPASLQGSLPRVLAQYESATLYEINLKE
jgi:uncharacterized membrane protein